MNNSENAPQPSDANASTGSDAAGKLVPKPIPIGLTVLIIALTGLGFVLMPPAMVSPLLVAKVFAIYLLGIPALFLLSREVINRFFDGQVYFRNSLTLGLLMSLMVILWQMGSYS